MLIKYCYKIGKDIHYDCQDLCMKCGNECDEQWEESNKYNRCDQLPNIYKKDIKKLDKK